MYVLSFVTLYTNFGSVGMPFQAFWLYPFLVINCTNSGGRKTQEPVLLKC
jgi:hypothetical protein